VVQNRASVSGAITFDGKPLPAGVVQFQSTEHTVTSSVMIFDGSYATDRAPLGKNTVTIETSSVLNGNPRAYVPIPAKYSDSTKSGLSAEIKPGSNEHVDFELKK
jgi:hypothetical protein